MTAKLTVHFKARDFTALQQKQDIALDVQSMGWNAIGGCDTAQIAVKGGDNALWELVDFLRYPVEIYDDKSRAVWWGYVNEVSINTGAVRFGVSLDNMANRVTVVYSYIAPGSDQVGERRTTEWATDANSVSEYGTKDLYQSVGGASDAQATALVNTLLDQKKLPIPTLSFSALQPVKTASLYCRGWWSTLDWRQYACDPGTVATTTQISNGIAGHAQFITACDVQDASGIDASAYRDGDSTLQSEVEEMLKTGISTDRRLLARVDVNRRAYVYAEPLPTDPTYTITRTGKIYDQYEAVVEPYAMSAGVWVTIKDVIPASANLSKLANPSPFFVESCEWSGGKLQLFPRGQGNPYEIINNWIP